MLASGKIGTGHVIIFSNKPYAVLRTPFIRLYDACSWQQCLQRGRKSCFGFSGNDTVNLCRSTRNGQEKGPMED